MPQPSGNGPRIAGNDRTQLLPPVARQSRPEPAPTVWNGWEERLAEYFRPEPVAVPERWRRIDPETEQRLVAEWQAECRRTAAASWILDRAALTAPYRLGYDFGPRRDHETAVIPVTPAQPGPKANNDDPWKECFGAAVAGLVLAAFIFVAGVLVGAAVF